jgi:crotonobetainyl-CoA:carnitine CoA-transferase CaiB-like acyl-CoA transferase
MAYKGAYDGIVVADFGHVIAAPYAARMMADHGAEVIKIESFDGDMLRRMEVQYGGDLSSTFAQYNVGKKAIAVDLKHPEGKKIAHDIIAKADVVLQNFSTGTFNRLVGTYEDLKKINPTMVMCSISSFGAEGPYADLPGFGFVAEAYSGLMSLAASDDGYPSFFGTALADMNVATHAYAAVTTALFRRERTGEGTHIDMSSFDALVVQIDQAMAISAVSNGDKEFPPYSRRHGATVPNSIVRTRDGEHVVYGAPSDDFFRRLCEAMGQPELTQDPRFNSNANRVANRAALYEIVEQWAASFNTADELVDVLRAQNMACARIRKYTENITDPHLIQRGTLAPVQLDADHTIYIQTTPHRLEGSPVFPQGPAPHIGEHSQEILHQLGRSESQISQYFQDNIVR